jgi:hypothetical protein
VQNLIGGAERNVAFAPEIFRRKVKLSVVYANDVPTLPFNGKFVFFHRFPYFIANQ